MKYFLNVFLRTDILVEDLQKEHLETMEKQLQEELEIIREEFDTERAMLLDQHNKEMSDIADILFAMEQNFNERENDAKAEFQSMRDEVKNKVRGHFRVYVGQSEK